MTSPQMHSRGNHSREESSSMMVKEESSTGTSSNEVRIQTPKACVKACVTCRRSKVKCVHDGGPPCRRCKDSNQECKFRLRADDETWRERIDDTLSKLASAVDTLLSREQVPPPHQNVNIPVTSNFRPSIQGRNMSAPGLFMNAAPQYSPDSGHTIGPVHRPSLPAPPLMPNVSTYVDTTTSGVPEYRSPSIHDGTSTCDMPSPSYTRRGQVRKRDCVSEWDAEHTPYLNGTNLRSPSSAASSSYQRPRLNSATSMPPPLTPAQVDQDQVMPSPILSHVSINTAPIYIHGYAIGPRWMMGNTTSYAKATLTIGRDDPRMNAISIGLVAMDRAKALFVFFADKLQPHSFGFPTYPASEQMTPVIISSILMVAAMHDPFSRRYHAALKNDCLASIKPEQEVIATQALDPELGIGVEEITGACIASAWLGGETGWRISRVARWWAIAYLKHFEIPSRSLTLGECLTILPPFRQIDLVDKLRIWLAAYVAEAQQAFVLDRPSIVPNQSPAPYVDALRTAFNDSNSPNLEGAAAANDTRGSMTGGSGGSIKHPPPPDRQLMGHAAILNILLGAQRVQRESRWAAEAATARESNGSRGYSPQMSGPNGLASMSAVRDSVDRVIASWEFWMNETEKWKADVCSLEDLSSSTASAMDLTLTYWLTKAHLGSLALEPEYSASATVAKAASQDPKLLQAQSKIITIAKVSALAALNLAINQVGFLDRLVYLPSYYHFLLGHCAGYLLVLVQRKYRFMLAGEAKVVLEAVERFCNIYISDIANHNFHPNASTSPHPGLAIAEALSRSCAHLRAQAKGN